MILKTKNLSGLVMSAPVGWGERLGERGEKEKGFRAKRAIAEGETVGFIEGLIVSRRRLKDHPFAIKLDDDRYLALPLNKQERGFFHACDPNCAVDSAVRVIAIKPIAKHQFLTLDYATLFDDFSPFLCSCGSPYCRGLIKPTDFFKKKLFLRYKEAIAPYFRDRFDGKFEANAWGWLTSIDLYRCDPYRIQSRESIEKYIIDLCDLIDMKRFGDPVIVDFGEDPRVAGYSMFQLIETSCISGHFANQSHAAYIDIFSCKLYDPKKAALFSVRYFGAKEYRYHMLNRF